MKQRDLRPLLPALLDALGYAGTGVMFLVDVGSDLERWYTNTTAAEIVGYTPEEIYAIDPYDLVIDEQRARIRELVASFRNGSPVPAALEIAVRHKDGSAVTLELDVGTARLPDGALAYAMVVRDVAKATSQLTLLEADRIGLVGALSAGFAHEINNPLTSVLLNLRSLRKQLAVSSPVVQRCLEDLTTGAERIAGNVRALQTLATRSDTQELDLAAVASAAFRLAAPTLEPRAHVIRRIEPVRRVVGEESRIGQAVLAMMLFSGSGFEVSRVHGANKIEIAVEDRGTDVVVEVSDNGHDLTPEETRRAFDPFFRSPSRGSGVGVGLGVARSVAATAGGEVTLAPRSGGGAVVTMRLPGAAA